MTEQETMTDEQVEIVDGAVDKDARADEPFISFSSKKEFQNAIDACLKERLDRERGKAENAEEKAREEARDAALKENEEWKELAEKREKTIQKLQADLDEAAPYKERSDKYGEALAKQLNSHMTTVPEHIKDLLRDRDPVDQLDWLTEHKDAWAPKAANGRVPATPPADDASAHNEARAQEAASSQRALGLGRL